MPSHAGAVRPHVPPQPPTSSRRSLKRNSGRPPRDTCHGRRAYRQRRACLPRTVRATRGTVKACGR
jgi:hypothetical protein